MSYTEAPARTENVSIIPLPLDRSAVPVIKARKVDACECGAAIAVGQGMCRYCSYRKPAPKPSATVRRPVLAPASRAVASWTTVPRRRGGR